MYILPQLKKIKIKNFLRPWFLCRSEFEGLGSIPWLPNPLISLPVTALVYPISDTSLWSTKPLHLFQTLEERVFFHDTFQCSPSPESLSQSSSVSERETWLMPSNVDYIYPRMTFCQLSYFSVNFYNLCPAKLGM